MSAFWTIAPMETLFSEAAKPPSYREIACGNATLLVEDVSDRQCRVVRVLSTDPMDFLTDRLQPGTVLRLNESYS